MQLFGTRESQGSLPGSAILGAGDGEQKSYAVGEEVAPGVTLAKVAFDHVVLSRGGSTQTIYMAGAEGAASAAAPSAGSAVATAVGNAFQLKPRVQGTVVSGVLVTPGSNPQLFAAAGFRDGDVIVAVNGARITSMIDVQQLQSSIAPGARLLLTVERGAETVPIALNLPSNR
ncbi:MAG TPA: type II secretion system protein N [Sphingomicrobium sp.]|nr:type II secretion system protein N [Sphingomicrobium sp.]